MPKKKKYDSHTPVLNSYLLEGIFVSAMEQIMHSIDCCQTHKMTPDMDLGDHVKALHNISIQEMEEALMFVEGRHEDTLNKKHKCYVRRTRTVCERLKSLKTDTDKGKADVLRLVLNWIQDAHLIMHEDTDHKIRVFLSEKDMSDDAKTAKRVIGVQ